MIRGVCLFVLACVTWPVGATDRTGIAKPWDSLIEMLHQSGLEKTDARSLVAWLRTAPPSADRWSAIEVLGLRGDREAIPVLQTLVSTEKDRLIQETAALALARLDVPEGKEKLRSFLESSKDEDRQIFLAARLAELGDEVGFPYVSRAARGKSAERRRESASALVAFLPLQKAQSQEMLLDLARDDDATVRLEFAVQAPIAISKGADRETFKATLRGLSTNDTDPQVRSYAALMLSGLEFEDEERERSSRQ